jgi:ribosomal protein S26
MLVEKECSHGEVELLGEQKGERGSNRYYRCLKCGSVLILSEEGVLYEVPKGRETKTETRA